MRKLLLVLIFSLCIPVVYNCVNTNANLLIAEETIRQVEGDENIGHYYAVEKPGPIVEKKHLFGGMLVVLAILFIIFIIIAPFLIFSLVYEMVPNDSYIKHIMDIAIAIFGVLTLGLFYIDKRK